MTVEKTCRLNDYRYINREGVSSMNRVYSNKTQGFTLVELLVVMLVLVALSSITLDFTKDFAFQGRYEVTKDRYDKIKRAIIGRPDVLINGQPDISGFVADMGRLPRNIQELLVQNYCMPDYTISDNRPDADIIGTYATKQEWCEGEYVATVEWVEQTAWVDPTATSLGYGWRGPYITAQNPDFQENAFSDGWGSFAVAITDHNYGWRFVHEDASESVIATINTNLASIGNATTLDIQSLAKDQALGGSGYDEDYPVSQPTISQNDWLLNISYELTATFQKFMGSCQFTREPCLNSGGIWQEACTFQNADNNNLCGNGTTAIPDITGTLWLEALDYCKFNQASCESPNSHIAESGAWKTCHFSESSCSDISGSWNELFTTSTNCTNAGGVWNTTISHCEFSTLVNCEAAGGNWDSNTEYCNTCDIKTPAVCTGVDGVFTGSWPGDLSECNNAGGNWDGSNCVGASLCQFKPTQCDLAKGAWQPSCTFNKAHCEHANIDGIWNTAAVQCSLDGFISNEKCIEQQGEWVQDAEFIVMTVRSRNNDGTISVDTSEPERIFEDGNHQTISFVFDGDQATAAIDALVVPMGKNNIGVYKAYATTDNLADCGFNWNVRLGTCFDQTDDFYPASCSGLDEATCEAADGGDTVHPAILLANNMCDNVTVNECEAAGGHLIRNIMRMNFIANNQEPIFNW